MDKWDKSCARAEIAACRVRLLKESALSADCKEQLKAGTTCGVFCEFGKRAGFYDGMGHHFER